MRSIEKLLALSLILVLVVSLTGCSLINGGGKSGQPDADSITAAIEEQRQSKEAAKEAQIEAHEGNNASQKADSDPEVDDPSEDSSADPSGDPSGDPSADSSAVPSTEPVENAEENVPEGENPDESNDENSVDENSALEGNTSIPPVHDPKVDDFAASSTTYQEAADLYAPIIEAAGIVVSSAGASDEASIASFEAANQFFESEDCLGFYDFFLMPDAPAPKYVIADVDNNGSLELLLLAGDNSGIVLSMFTLVDGTPCHVFCSWSRSTYYFTSTGDFLYKGSSGAADSIAAIYAYRLGEMILVEAARMESYHVDPDGSIVSEIRFFDEFPDESMQITEEEFYELYAAISSVPVITADEVVAYFAP